MQRAWTPNALFNSSWLRDLRCMPYPLRTAGRQTSVISQQRYAREYSPLLIEIVKMTEQN